MKLNKFVYKSVLSTNSTAIRKIKNGFKNGIVVADNQTKGRGKYNKKWISIKGNLFTSIFYEINKVYNLKKLTNFHSKLILRCLKKFIKKKINFKFPNDIMINKQKICGILQETITVKKKNYIIVGVGINVVESPKLNEYKTSYLNKFLIKKISKKTLFNHLKMVFEKNLKVI